MATARLTHQLRSIILENAMKDVFVKEKAEYEADRLALSKKIYDAIVTPNQQKLIAKLPKEFFYRSESMHVGLRASETEEGDTMFQLRFEGGEYRAFQETHRYRRPRLVDPKLREECDALEKRNVDLERREEDLREAVSGVLKSATTVAKLLEIWPGCKQFIPAEALNVIKGTNLPMVIVDNLNNMLAKALGKPLAI